MVAFFMYLTLSWRADSLRNEVLICVDSWKVNNIANELYWLHIVMYAYCVRGMDIWYTSIKMVMDTYAV